MSNSNLSPNRKAGRDFSKKVDKMLKPKKKRKKKGCYVATCVYGSYDCPEVWTLRRYRDYSLAQVWYGKCFIILYYAISPLFVSWFGNAEWFKIMWRVVLDNMVNKLQKEGYESTPYSDNE